MRTKQLPGTDPNHAHDVTLEGTFAFLNTDDLENGFPLDQLPTLDAALSWFVERGVIHYEGAERWRALANAKPSAAEHELARIHHVRAALREVAESIAEHRAPKAEALDVVNQALHARQVIELITGPDGVHVDHRHVGDPIDDALARLADPLVRELTGGHPERIRVCDSDRCLSVFYDSSRTGRRRWCSMATCGNQAKAARHRARAKGVDGTAVSSGAETAFPA